MGLKLDKHRGYGIVYGHTTVAYEQDGLQFRPDGTLYDDEEKQEQLAPQTLRLPEKQRDGLR